MRLVRTIPAGTFKAQCLALLDQVAASGETIVVTKRGKPVAEIRPVGAPRDLTGTVTYLVDDDELLFSTGESWDAERE